MLKLPFALFCLCTVLMANRALPLNSRDWSSSDEVYSGEEEMLLERGRQCTIKIGKFKQVYGKCVQLSGGHSACKTDEYLDMVNGDCARPFRA